MYHNCGKKYVFEQSSVLLVLFQQLPNFPITRIQKKKNSFRAKLLD